MLEIIGQGLTQADKVGVVAELLLNVQTIATNLMNRSMKIIKHLATHLYITRINHVHTPVFHSNFG